MIARVSSIVFCCPVSKCLAAPNLLECEGDANAIFGLSWSEPRHFSLLELPLQGKNSVSVFVFLPMKLCLTP
jgi:hypothetical protein